VNWVEGVLPWIVQTYWDGDRVRGPRWCPITPHNMPTPDTLTMISTIERPSSWIENMKHPIRTS
jgi:hypothetical protein